MAIDPQVSNQAALQLVSSLLDAGDRPLLVADRRGRILFKNLHAQDKLRSHGFDSRPDVNLYDHVLRADRKDIFTRLESGEQELVIPLAYDDGNSRARIRWLPEPDWFVVYVEPSPAEASDEDTQMRQTVQELMQERETTYRNLLAAYLRLQEVNRQKTVFLASAAHELKTPLAVMKGYYDLLLTGSLGRLSEKQREILDESKQSCDRLVRLVSMFLNYSALESGKLVLQLRENDLRDCINDVICRWQDPFQRAGIRLETNISPTLPLFKFDYPKIQQCISNLVDNALKHTPAGGVVTLHAAPHFWDRRLAEIAPVQERRRN